MTGLNSNINQVIEHFQSKALAMKQVDVSEALLVGVNAAMGQMKYRIFNEGQDSDGVALGSYKGAKKKAPSLFLKGRKKEFLVGSLSSFTPYELKRLAKGRQVRYKDEEFTGTLRRSIVVVKDSNVRVVCAIPSVNQRNIANYQEEQVGRIRGGGKIRIFSLSQQERELLRTNCVAALKQIYARVLHS
jgi:hypothetical protein